MKIVYEGLVGISSSSSCSILTPVGDVQNSRTADSGSGGGDRADGADCINSVIGIVCCGIGVGSSGSGAGTGGGRNNVDAGNVGGGTGDDRNTVDGTGGGGGDSVGRYITCA